MAYQLALDLAAKWARMVEVTVDHQTTRANQRYEQYRQLAADLKSQLDAASAATSDIGFPGAYVGGIGDDRGGYDYPGLPDLGLQ